MWHVPIHVIIMNRLYNKMSLLYQKIYIHLIIKYYSEGWWGGVVCGLVQTSQTLCTGVGGWFRWL